MECSIRRYVFLVWILIEILSFGGIMFGWGALVFVLNDEGFFSELCRKNQTENLYDYERCTERDEEFNLYFVISMSVGLLIPIITTHCVAKLGTRTTRLISSVCFAVGCILFAMAENGYPWLICVGGILVTGFGLTFMITSLKVNVLFPKHSSTVIGLMNGIYDSSAVVPLVVKSLYVHGVGRQTSFLILMGFSSITVISSFVFFPKSLRAKLYNKHDVTIDSETLKYQIVTLSQESTGHVKTTVRPPIRNTDENEILNEEQTGTNAKYSAANKDNNGVANSVHLDASVVTNVKRNQKGDFDIYVNKTKDTEINESTKYGTVANSVPLNHCNDGEHDRRVSADNKTTPSLRNNIFSIGFVMHIIWFAILYLRFIYTIGTMNPKIEKLTQDGNNSVSYYTDVLSYTMFCGLISSFGAGFLYDYQKSFFQPIVHPMRRALASSIIPLCVTSGLAMILSGLMFIQNENVLYVLPIIITLFRSVLFTVFAAFIVTMFPESQFEQLYAITVFISNVFGFVQYALFQWTNAYADGEKQVNVTFLLLCCLTLVHPIRIYVKQRHLH